jgi:hypothetical protein
VAGISATRFLRLVEFDSRSAGVLARPSGLEPSALASRAALMSAAQ